MKKIFKYIFWTIFAFIIALLLLPFLFKQKIIDGITNAINDQIDAELTIEDAGISFFHSFPLINIHVDKLSLTNKAPFEGYHLFKADQIDLETDLISIIKNKEGIKIINIELRDPVLNILVNDKGQENYDILKPSEASEGEIFGEIKSYKVMNGKLSYVDRQTGFDLGLEGIEHNGKGNFRDVIFDLSTTTNIEKVNATYADVAYLKNAVLKGDLDLKVDLNQDLYTFKDNLIHLNDLALSVVGDFQLKPTEYVMNLEYQAPNNKVSNLFSLIPNAYTADYGNIKSEGQASLSGIISGIYNEEKGIFPKVTSSIKVDQGRIQYPGFKLPIEDIFFSLYLAAGQGDWQDLAIDLSSLKFKLDKESFIASMKVADLFGNASFDGFANGKINLNTLSKAFPMPQYDDVEGIIQADFNIKARKDAILSKDYDNIDFRGKAEINRLKLNYSGNSPIEMDGFNMTFSPQSIETEIGKAAFANSQLSGKLSITNPLSVLVESQEKLKIGATFRSDYMDFDALEALMVVQSDSLSANGSSANDSKIPEFSTIDAVIDLELKSAKYQDYQISNAKFNGNYSADSLVIHNAGLSINGATVSGRGHINNLMNYVSSGETLNGKLFVESEKIDFDQLRGDNNNASASTESVIIIPKNINISIYPEIASLSYGKYKFSNFDARIDIAQGMASIVDGKAKLFDGKVFMDGSYDSNDPSEPRFNFKFSLADLAIAKMFENSPTFRYLAPIAQYIDGIFNSTLVFSGPLDKEMMPNLYKINASGIFETAQGHISGFKPLEVLGNTLGIDKLKNWNIKDSKNWFEIKEGTVFFKETDYSFDNMEFKVAGSHSIDQKINYLIKAKIPREKLRNSQVGKQLDKGLDLVISEAKKRGVNIDQGDFIFLDIFLTENLKDPKIKIVPVGSGGQSLKEQIQSEVDQKIEKIKDDFKAEVNKKTEAIKDTVTKVIDKKTNEVKDKIEEKANEEIEKVKDQVKDKIKNSIDSTKTNEVVDQIENKVGEELKDMMGDKSQKEIDSIKSIIKDWNPFKKKKK